LLRPLNPRRLVALVADLTAAIDASSLADRIATGEALWLARMPLVLRRHALARLERSESVAKDAGAVELLLAAGQSVEPVSD